MRVIDTDVVVLGFGAAGACTAIAAHDAGADVVLVEKQPEATHHSNTRMSSGGYHSPDPAGDRDALRAYARAMFSGEGLPQVLPAESNAASELADLWAEYAPQNEPFMRGLDPDYDTVRIASVAFPQFPGAAASGYAVVRSTYSGSHDEKSQFRNTRTASKTEKQVGEAFHACLSTGLAARDIPVHYGTRARSLLADADGSIAGVVAETDGGPVTYRARRGVVLTTGGYEYSRRMRDAFLDGPGVDAWAFYGTSENTGDGIEMALRAGAGLSKAGSVAAHLACAVPVRRHGLRIGLSTPSIGRPNAIVVDARGRRYASERRISKDPSRYIFYRDAVQFDTEALNYPRVPSWMVFDTTLLQRGPLVRNAAASYNGIVWSDDNSEAVAQGWILSAPTLAELAIKIAAHADNLGQMEAVTLADTVSRYNQFCRDGNDLDFAREPDSLGPVETGPFYAMPLYPGGPNTKGGLRANPRRQVLDWQDRPIPRLYAVGEIASVFQFAYQGGGNLAECIAFGRVAGNAVAREHVRP